MSLYQLGYLQIAGGAGPGGGGDGGGDGGGTGNDPNKAGCAAQF